jgi:prepilin signal peptidase PulO-like enzyme (type II secretory pathway)
MLISVALIVFIFLGNIQDKVPDYQIYARCVIGYSYIYILCVLSKGKIGLGDAMISALIALVLGLKSWIWALIFASMFGIIYGAVLMKCKMLTIDSKIPYAPFLTLGCCLVLLLRNLLIF